MSQIFWFLLRPSSDQMAKVNPVFYGLIICWAPLLGSVSTAIAIAGMVFNGGHLATGRFVRRTPPAVHYCTLAFAGFFLAELVAQLLSRSPFSFGEVVENLPFLGLYLIYVGTTATRARILDVLEWMAASVSLLAAASLLVHYPPGGRLELMAGNASVLTVLVAILYLLNLVALVRGKNGWPRLLFVVSALCSVLLLGEAGTRSLWPALLLVPLVVLLLLQPGVLRAQIGKIAWVSLLATAIAAAVLWTPVSVRWERTVNELQSIQAGNTSSSLGQRLVLWRSAAPIIAENPFLGVGPSDAMAILADKTEELYGVRLGFTHAHNMFINELLRAGIIGLLALVCMFLVPLVVVTRAVRDREAQAGYTILIGVQGIYLLSGTTGLAVGNDILDAVFITATAACLYLVFGNPPEKQPALQPENGDSQRASR